MIVFKVEDDRLTNITNSIQIPVFEELTGRRIDWAIRVGKDIIVEKTCSHVALRDPIFIVGLKYRYQNKVWICTYMSADGHALLTPTSYGNLLAKPAKDTTGWDIVNK